MAVPNIIAFGIDEGLIHGQGQLWIRTFGVNTVVVTDDSVGEGSMQQMLMKAVVPKTIVAYSFSIQYTCDVVMKVSPKQTTSVVCKTPEDALKLVTDGIPVKEINVDNIHHAPGKEEMSRHITLSGKDRAALRQLHDTYGVAFNTGTTASGDDGAARVDLNKYF